MNMRIAGRIGAIALLLASGGCEFLKDHVKVQSDDRSPGEDRHFSDAAAESRSNQAAVRVDLWRADNGR